VGLEGPKGEGLRRSSPGRSSDAAVGPRAGVSGRDQGAASQCSSSKGLKEQEGEKRETKVSGEESPSPRKTRMQRGGWIQLESGSRERASLSRAGGGPGWMGPAL